MDKSKVVIDKNYLWNGSDGNGDFERVVTAKKIYPDTVLCAWRNLQTGSLYKLYVPYNELTELPE